MSQHLATATLDGHPVEIVAGFDRRLGDYFLQVIDERNDMLYTSLQEPLLDWTDIATLRAKVAELGLHCLRSWSTRSNATAVDARATASSATSPKAHRTH
jgi:hypothetical protein